MSEENCNKNDENTRKRKRSNKNSGFNKSLDFTEKLQNIEHFLQEAENFDTPNESNCSITVNRDVFDTLDSVSTDDSDMEITHVTEPNKLLPKIVTSSPISNKNSQTKESHTLAYFYEPPLGTLMVTESYLDFSGKLNVGENNLTDSSSASDSSDSCQNKDSFNPTMLDNGDCFIVDNESVARDSKSIQNSDRVAPVKVKHRTKRKSEKRFPNNPELKTDPKMFKYWSQRYDLFERFDMGIRLDKESWFSVTPEYVAKEQSELCDENDTVLDGFCGAGGNTIQFAYRCKKVFAVDIDNEKVTLARHNVNVYGVDSEKVTIIKDNYYHFCSLYDPNCPKNMLSLPDISVVFLSPPWGGQNYIGADQTITEFDLTSIDMNKLMQSARQLAPRMIIVFLPRNTNTNQLQAFARPNESLTILKHGSRYKNNDIKKIKAITAVYKLA